MRNPNGVGSVIKLSGKRRRPFAVRITEEFTPEGKQVYKYLGYFKTRKEALQFLYTYKKHDVELADKITLGSLLDLYIEYKQQVVKPSTLASIKSHLKFYKPLFKVDYRKITIDKVQYLFDNNMNYRKKTIKSILSVLSNFINFINKRGYKMENFTHLIEVHGKEKKEKRIYTDDEIKMLWDNIDHEQYHIIIRILLILLYTGTRINEILNLRTENIYLDDNYIITGSKTEKGKNRVIPIHKKIKPLIEEYYNPKNEYFIYMTYSGFKYHFVNFREKFKLNHTIHETRHTFITRMRELSEDLDTIQDIVGHTDVQTLNIYTHRTKNKDKMKELVDLLE